MNCLICKNIIDVVHFAEKAFLANITLKGMHYFTVYSMTVRGPIVIFRPWYAFNLRLGVK